ncbi:MAG: hypothetical protein ACXVJ1_16405, partial [Candidatus Angelobacter sp.]
MLCEGMAANTQLRSLNLCGNRFGDAGMASLSKVLMRKVGLGALAIQGCDIGSDGARALSQVLMSSTSLRSL